MPGDPFHDDVWCSLLCLFINRGDSIESFLKESRCLKKGTGSRIIAQAKVRSGFSEEPLKSSDHMKYSFFQILLAPDPDKPTWKKEVLSNYQTHLEKEKIVSKGKFKPQTKHFHVLGMKDSIGDTRNY